MPALDLDSISPKGSIGIKEAIRRLRENPNDLEAQSQLSSFNKGLQEMSAKMKTEINELLDTPVATIRLARNLSSPKYRHRVAILEGINLVSRIPKTGKKHNIARKVATLFLNTLKVDNFEIIKRIKSTTPGYKGKSRKFIKDDYMKGKEKYDKKIKNRFKYLGKVANKLGFTFKFHELYVEAIQLT